MVLFLDTRPEDPAERSAFRHYMEHGGAWMGFHFAAFALTPSKYPQNWDWYHDEFLGAGQYVSNTWRPTAATLRVESGDHPIMAGLPRTITSAPNEWYRWQRDLRANRDIRILLSIDPSSFPLGTGPKPEEIWHSGDYPVAWTNTRYRMVYMNMGHNDMDYGGTNRAALVDVLQRRPERVHHTSARLARSLWALGSHRRDLRRVALADERLDAVENALETELEFAVGRLVSSLEYAGGDQRGQRWELVPIDQPCQRSPVQPGSLVRRATAAPLPRA